MAFLPVQTDCRRSLRPSTNRRNAGGVRVRMIYLEAAHDETNEIGAEFGILKIQLLELFIGNDKQPDVADAYGGSRSPAGFRENILCSMKHIVEHSCPPPLRPGSRKSYCHLADDRGLEVQARTIWLFWQSSHY